MVLTRRSLPNEVERLVLDRPIWRLERIGTEQKSWQTGRAELRRMKDQGWPMQVSEIEPARSENHPGLQAADLLSWVIRCRYEYGDKLLDSKIPMVMLTFMAAGKLRGGFLNDKAIRDLYIERCAPDFQHTYNFV